MAVAEPQNFTQQALLRFSLPSPSGLIRLLIQQSNCFLVVERGVAMQNILQERRLSQTGQLQEGQNIGQGQLVTADFILTPDVVFSERDAGGAGIALGATFGVIGSVVAAGMRTRQAQTSMIVADTRSGLQVAAAQGSVEKSDWGIGGAVGGGSAIGALGAYESTPQGKVVAASFLDNWNNVVRAIRSESSLQRREVSLQIEAGRTVQAGPSLEKGDMLSAKISGVAVLSDADENAKRVGTLTRGDDVVFLDTEQNGFLLIQGSGGRDWVEKIFLNKR